jgi:hypothetical protein
LRLNQGQIENLALIGHGSRADEANS